MKLWFIALLLSATSALALTIGDTRETVIAELGEPQSKMSSGRREMLNYSGGRIMLIDGKVREYRGKFSPPSGEPESASSPAAAARSPAPAAPVAKPEPAPRRGALWFTNLTAAQESAKKENKLILALFTGTDWCPPCKAFEAEVAHDEQFAGIFNGSFVFFKNDWLRNTPQPTAVIQEVRRVRQKYHISRYPTLKILNAEGEVLDTVDWTGVEGGGSFKEIMIEAIDNSRKATKGGVKVKRSMWPF